MRSGNNKGIKNIILFTLVLILVYLSYPVEIRERTESGSYTGPRKMMVGLLKEFGIRDLRLLSAMNKIKRHLFIPEKFRKFCDPYGNHPCPIGSGQTISQPYIVAYMTERLNIKKGENILEIGTGSGYQAAVLAEIGARVISLEIIDELSEHAKKVLAEQGYGKVKVVKSSGYIGYPSGAPYDGIIVTCAPSEIPENLLKDLKEGGRMIIPVGRYSQKLLFIRKKKGKILVSTEMNVRFVPMVRESSTDLP
ncbi:MAG: protein-L-isoaspartate(D-aspartate) O-methyltransferase [Acidobacteriota bacterium]